MPRRSSLRGNHRRPHVSKSVNSRTTPHGLTLSRPYAGLQAEHEIRRRQMMTAGGNLADARSLATSLIARRKRGYALEAPFYSSQEIFDLDMEAIWTRHWLSVGVEADVPEPGDFVTVDIGKYSVIVVRGEDREVR